MNSIHVTLATLTATLLLASFRPDAALAQGPMTPGATMTGAIAVQGEADSWTFTANAGDAIVVRMGEIVEDSALYPYLRIYSPTSAYLDGGYGPASAEVAVTAPVSGTYTVVACDYYGFPTSLGDYRLTLAQTGGAITISPGDQGGPLTNGSTHLGTMDIGDLDSWTVSATAGDAIVVRMGETVANSALYPWLRIYSPTGAYLDGSYGPASAEVAVTAPVTGTYVVVVGDYYGYATSVGDYRLTLMQTGTPVAISPGDQGGPMTNGTTHLGTMDIGDLDPWTVTATAGDAIVVRVGEIAAGSAFYPMLRIYSPTGAYLDGSYGAASAEVAVTAPVTGTYVVVVTDYYGYATSVGDYRLTLMQTGTAVAITPGDQGDTMTNGTTHLGTMDIGDLDPWTVTATAGDAIVVRVGEITAGSAFYPMLRIYSPTGAYLDGSYGAASAEVAVTAPVTGTYVVVVTDYYGYDTSTGDYRLTLAQTGKPVVISPGDEGGPTTGGVLHGFMDIGDLDAWTITVTAGQPVTATVEESAAGSTFYPLLRLYSPTGTYLAGSYGASSAHVSVTAPVSGTYLAIVTDYYGTGTGPYHLAPNNAAGVGDPQPVQALAFAPCAPNPFVASTVLRYSVPAAGAASVKVFDAQGRLVRTLVDESLQAAGAHEAVWDGRDAAGTRAHPGVYLARLNAGGRSMVQRVVLAR